VEDLLRPGRRYNIEKLGTAAELGARKVRSLLQRARTYRPPATSDA